MSAFERNDVNDALPRSRRTVEKCVRNVPSERIANETLRNGIRSVPNVFFMCSAHVPWAFVGRSSTCETRSNSVLFIRKYFNFNILDGEHGYSRSTILCILIIINRISQHKPYFLHNSWEIIISDEAQSVNSYYKINIEKIERKPFVTGQY